MVTYIIYIGTGNYPMIFLVPSTGPVGHLSGICLVSARFRVVCPTDLQGVEEGYDS